MTTTDERLTGTVKFFLETRGFGFFVPDKQTHPEHDYFVHVMDLHRSALRTLEAGSRVSFVVGERKGRQIAQDIRLEQ